MNLLTVSVLVILIFNLNFGSSRKLIVRKENERPIIGILSQELSANIEAAYPGTYKSFVAASYVKFIEGAGARVVPIWIGQEKKYYDDILSKINGVLFPGGSSWFENKNGYADAGEIIYKIAREINDGGEYFPLWGTCLGFELLTYLSADRREHRASCSSQKQALNLQLKPDFETSKMLSGASKRVISILSNEYVTSNFHSFCTTEKNLTQFDIDNEWKVISENYDVNGLKFISAIESRTYPFYGVQFHPEKNLYEWVTDKNITHTSNAVKANSYFAEFFVSEARKSNHKFAEISEEASSLIYNFPSTYTALQGVNIYQQCYLFH